MVSAMPPDTTPVHAPALAGHQTLHLCMFERSGITKHYACAGLTAYMHLDRQASSESVNGLIQHAKIHLDLRRRVRAHFGRSKMHVDRQASSGSAFMDVEHACGSTGVARDRTSAL